MGSEAQADHLTRLQDGVDTLVASLHRAVVDLQRDAPPIPPDGEPMPPESVQAMEIMKKHSEELVEEMLRTSQKIDELADSIPGIEKDEAAQNAEIARLQEENDAAEAELRVALAAAEAKLGLVKDALNTVVVDTGGGGGASGGAV